MQQWALVVADSLLIAIGLAGGVLTLARGRRLGRTMTVLAACSCAILLAAATADLIWWFDVFPDRVASTDPDQMRAMTNTAVLTTSVLICASYALLIAAVHVGPRRAVPIVAPPPPPMPRTPPPVANSSLGWTPPRQAQPDDWATTSGVWSMPRGAFDQPQEPPRS
jgi:hypothetical protein